MILFVDHPGKLAKRFHCAMYAHMRMTNRFHPLLTADLPSATSLLLKH